MRLQSTLEPFQLALRAAVAAGIALAIAELAELQHPLFSAIAAVIATDLSPLQSRKLGSIRLVATVIGAVCGAALTPLLPSGPVAVGIAILVAMLICTLTRAQDGARVAGYICAIIVFEDSSAPWIYAWSRFVETALGVVVAWCISYVPKLISTKKARENTN